MNGEDGHTSPFGLIAKQDPLLATTVPAARRKVCLTTRICEAARMFYCYLTDCSLLPGVNTRKGVVKFSDLDLALRFKVSERTIRNWKRALEDIGEVWLTERYSKNTFPQTVYNITAIVGQAMLPMNAESEDGSLPDDAVFSSNRRRQQTARRDHGSGKFSCRLHGVSACPVCRRQTPPGVPPPEVSGEILQNQAENEAVGKILPPTTENGCRPPRQPIAAHRGNPLPSPTATNCRPARKTVAAVGGNQLPPSAANGFRGERQTVADKGKTEIEGTSLKEGDRKPDGPPADAFKVWEDSLVGRYPSHLEKMREKFRSQVKLASPDGRALLKRKIARLDELLDGPQPEWAATTATASTATATPPKGAKKVDPAVIESLGKKLRGEVAKATAEHARR